MHRPSVRSTAGKSGAVPRHRETVRRLAAGGACLAGAAAGGGLVAAGAGRQPSGYLSELGVAGTPDATLYQASVGLAALGLALLAVALWLDRAVPGLPAVLFGVGAPLFAASGVVSCSPGCPLPPYDPGVTAGDLVHAGAAIAAFVAVVVAMLLLGAGSVDPVVRRLCQAAGALVGVLTGLTGVMMLAVGRGIVNGILERAAVTVALVWLVVIGARFSRPAPGVSPGMEGGPSGAAEG